jgi:hypothetical protein
MEELAHHPGPSGARGDEPRRDPAAHARDLRLRRASRFASYREAVLAGDAPLASRALTDLMCSAPDEAVIRGQADRCVARHPLTRRRRAAPSRGPRSDGAAAIASGNLLSSTCSTTHRRGNSLRPRNPQVVPPRLK